MEATTTLRQPPAGLLDWLASKGVEHEIHPHDEAFTARGVAQAEGVDPHTFAKVVGVETDDARRALIVIDATDHVDLRKARAALSAHEVRLLTEPQLTTIAPDCEAGAIPAVGALYGLPMVADHAVRDAREISFNAGSHRLSVRVDRAAWERATGVTYADVARSVDPRPTWARS